VAKPGELTPKQAAFVREYLVDGNGTQAAIRAGYSAKTAGAIAVENLTKPLIAEKVRSAMQVSAAKTETEAEWVRRRLKEEADDFSEFASHSARIKAIELIGKINGVFKEDNEQKATPLIALAATIQGHVAGPGQFSIEDDDGA
jgi:phage terminase small subunit